jgi:hypothetical protein
MVSLAQADRLVLGENLNCSESRGACPLQRQACRRSCRRRQTVIVNNSIVFPCPWAERPRARCNMGSDCKTRGCRRSPPRRTVRGFACCNCTRMTRPPCSYPRTTVPGRPRSGECRIRLPPRRPLCRDGHYNEHEMHGSSPAYMDYRTLRLPWRGRKVLRPELNRSEHRWDAAAPACAATNDNTPNAPGDRCGRTGGAERLGSPSVALEEWG